MGRHRISDDTLVTIATTPVAVDRVAPHRYTWTREDHEQPDMPYRAWHAAVAYKAGDVVYVDVEGTARLALVTHVWRDRGERCDRDPIAKYRVHLATKGGTWSRSWVYTWPGFIQRGYFLAGLAPDVPERVAGAWRKGRL